MRQVKGYRLRVTDRTLLGGRSVVRERTDIMPGNRIIGTGQLIR